MTTENCKKKVSEILESSDLNTLIDSLIKNQYVQKMLTEPALENYVPRAIISVAMLMEYEHFKCCSETGVDIEKLIYKIYA